MHSIVKRMAAVALGLVLAGYLGAAQAQTKIRVAYIASADFSSGFVAKDKGFFEQRGLDVEFVFVPLNSTTLPAAMHSGSIEIGGTTVTVLLQAIDGGLDLMAVAGAGVANKDSTNSGILVRTGLELSGPADFAGKRMGTPGIGSLFHVLFRNWLMENDVDPAAVTFVEAGYPTMSDILRSGNVDAVIASDPTMARIEEAGTGKIFDRFTKALPGTVPVIVYCATREWVEANPDAARAFREAVAEGAAFVAQSENEQETREIIAKFIDLSPEVIASMQLPMLRAEIPNESIEIMIDIMKKQDMLENEHDPAHLVLQ